MSYLLDRHINQKKSYGSFNEEVSKKAKEFIKEMTDLRRADLDQAPTKRKEDKKSIDSE